MAIRYVQDVATATVNRRCRLLGYGWSRDVHKAYNRSGQEYLAPNTPLRPVVIGTLRDVIARRRFIAKVNAGRDYVEGMSYKNRPITGVWTSEWMSDGDVVGGGLMGPYHLVHDLVERLASGETVLIRLGDEE